MSQRNSFLLGFLVLILFSCTDNKVVKLESTSIPDEVPLQGNLFFRFDNDLVSDSALNFLDKRELISFEPEINGQFKWIEKNVLLFMPSEQMKPSTNYLAKLKPELLADKKNTALEANNTVSFHTPYIEFLSFSSYWADAEDTNHPMPHIDLVFNYLVDPKKADEHIELWVGGEKRKINIESTHHNKIITCVAEGIKPSDNDQQVKLILKPGIQALGGNVPINSQVEKETTLLSAFKLSVYDIMPSHDGSEGRLTVNTSQQLDLSGIKNHVSITPEIEYIIEIQPQGFVLVSEDFDMKEKYTVLIEKGMPGSLGGTLKHEYKKEISFGQLKPSIKFANRDRVYLSGNGNKNIAINIINIENIHVKVFKLYANNMIHGLSSSDYYYDYHSDEYIHGYNYWEVERMSDMIWETDIATETLPREGNKYLYNIDFEDRFSQFPGVYMVKVFSEQDYWLKDHLLISISDIGLMTKVGKNYVTVFANSIKTAEPLANVKLDFIGRNNQTTGTATTDDNGIAKFKLDHDLPHGFDINLITATKGNDYNFLHFNRTEVNTSRFEVDGKYDNPSGYDAYIYGDRDLYRPGETINIACVVRDLDWGLPGTMPIKFKFIAPNGKEVKTVRKTLSEQGGFDASFELSPAAMTGSYTAQVYTSTDVFLASKNISVEEFMPDRIKVDLETNLDSMLLADAYECDITATNFFGPPAANRNYETVFSLKKRNFVAQTKGSYNFFINGTAHYFDETFRDGTTDSEGKAHSTFVVPETYANMGLLQGDLYATVFDETGRPVNNHKSVNIFTQDVFYGIANGGYYVKTNEAISVPLVATDIQGRVLSDVNVEVSVIKHEYKSVLSRSGRYFRYRSEKTERVVEHTVLKLDQENVSFSFSPTSSGKYEIRINKPGVHTYVSRTFWSYGWGSTSYSSFAVDTEGHIDIELDKDNYEVGETATVLLKAPFTGKILVCVEDRDVIDHFYIETDKRAASFELPITDAFVPNVYISATLIKAHDVSDFPLLVAHGFHPVMVENKNNMMAIEIEAEEKSRSKTKQMIRVKADPNAQLCIAAVDEGILQVSSFPTPNPYDFFYQKRALQVNSYDLYPLLFPEIQTGLSSTGGDGMGLGKRMNPIANKRVKLVSFWSGLIETDSRGYANFEIDIPQFSGSLRIMAVSYRDKKFGSSSKNMTVADPLVISATLPRFLSPADTILVPVNISNTTENVAKCKTKIKLEGPLDVIGTDDINIDIPANAESEVLYSVAVHQAIGESKITIDVSAFGEDFSHETDMPVRPLSPLQKHYTSGIIKAGDSETLSLISDKYIAASASNKVVFSRSPIVEFADDLDYLLRYPYGCVEQTVSSVFPQLYFADLVKDIYGYDTNMEAPEHNVREAINKLSLMQLYNGGLSYWPEHGSESWWGSVYACHFLQEAHKAGYVVDQKMLDNLYDYLRERLKSRETFTYYYNRNSKKTIARKEIPYSLYILAMAGKPQYATMNYYKARPELLSLDGQYLLAASYALSGNMDKYHEVLPTEFSGEESNPVFSGSFHSYIRDEAISLNAILEVDPDGPQISIMAKHLSQAMKTRYYLNTQERAFAFVALGKIARQNADNDIEAEISLDGKTVAEYNNQTLTIEGTKADGKEMKIETKGDGQLYYFWESEGISADGVYPKVDSYLKVRKNFYDRNGNLLNDLIFKQNDLIGITITIQSANAEYIENVAITDMLPAGFEIENTRLRDLPNMGWVRNTLNHDYIDIRDDRINLFVTVSPRSYTYTYFVRAVSPGTFQMGPVAADAMYNGEYHSYHGDGVVKVVRK